MEVGKNNNVYFVWSVFLVWPVCILSRLCQQQWFAKQKTTTFMNLILSGLRVFCLVFESVSAAV